LNGAVLSRERRFYFYILNLEPRRRCAEPPPRFFGSGTFAPDRRASESPIAIACFRLFTFFPLRPLFNFPRFISCIARFTFCWDFLLYVLGM